MKNYHLLIVTMLLLFHGASAQDLKEKILQDINQNFERKASLNNLVADSLDRRNSQLDIAIRASQDVSVKADRLLQRVQTLEKIQRNADSLELLVYQTNYQSAIVNLVSMHQEIKPLNLFNASRDFFDGLNSVGNPMNYDGYRTWFTTFQTYVERKKDKEAGLGVLSSLITLTGDLSKGTPFSGPITAPLFNGISNFIGTLGSNDRTLKMESEKMFLITAKVTQFTHDKELIDANWETITKELKDIQEHYEKVLKNNLAKIKVDSGTHKDSINQVDGFKRLNYIVSLSRKASATVSTLRTSESKEWKEKIYPDLLDVQALKLRFGNITFKISENLKSYQSLIQKYRSDTHIGTQVQGLENKLKEVQKSFDDNFRPIEYINSVPTMYKRS